MQLVNEHLLFILKTANEMNNNNKTKLISITLLFFSLIGIMEQSLSSFVTDSLYNKLLKE